ncbi:MAG: type II toxin-antitoxin system VapC family toxin [Thermoguttaceae bacterium]
MFLLDTDHLGIIQRRSTPEHANLTLRMRQHRLQDFFVSIISFHEQVTGWNAYIRRAHGTEGVVRGYAMFQEILVDFARMNVLPFDSQAADIFADLRRSGVRVGTMDLRIGSIGLARGLTVLTRNRLDFERIPGLAAEDWTVAARDV